MYMLREQHQIPDPLPRGGVDTREVGEDDGCPPQGPVEGGDLVGAMSRVKRFVEVRYKVFSTRYRHLGLPNQARLVSRAYLYALCCFQLLHFNLPLTQFCYKRENFYFKEIEVAKPSADRNRYKNNCNESGEVGCYQDFSHPSSTG